jgi:hypothetical protein
MCWETSYNELVTTLPDIKDCTQYFRPTLSVTVKILAKRQFEILTAVKMSIVIICWVVKSSSWFSPEDGGGTLCYLSKYTVLPLCENSDTRQIKSEGW